MNNTTNIEEKNDWFKFNIGDNQAIINISNIVFIKAFNKDEIKPMVDGNKLEVRGLIDALGHPMPVLDLNNYINIPEKNTTEKQEDEKNKTMILIVKITDPNTGKIKKIGLKTEVITDTIKLDNDTFFFEQESGLLFHKFFHDIVKIDDKFIYRFDVEELFKEIPRQWEEN